jgi:hypothetical protein
MPVTLLPNGKRKPFEKPVAYKPDGGKIFAYNAKRQPVCNSLLAGEWEKSGYNGKRCQNTATFFNGRCRKHGGTAPIGPAAPMYKHGKTSRAPERIKDAIRRSLEKSDQLSMAEDIGIVDARIEEVLGNLEEVLDEVTLRRLAGIAVDLNAVLNSEDMDLFEQLREYKRLAHGVIRLAEKGVSYTSNWSTLLRTQMQRTKMVEVERKKVQMDADLIHRDEFLAYFGTLIDDVLAIMHDAGEIAQFQALLEKREKEALRYGQKMDALHAGEPVIDAEFEEVEEEELMTA